MGKGEFWENDDYMAFLSPHPNTKGVTAVIPKKHYGSDCLALPDEVLQDFILVAKKVSLILLDYFPDVGRVGLAMEGTGIDHAHIKLYPLHGTENLKKGQWQQYHSQRNDYFDEYQGFLSSHDGPLADLQEIENLAVELRKRQR